MKTLFLGLLLLSQTTKASEFEFRGTIDKMKDIPIATIIKPSEKPVFGRQPAVLAVRMLCHNEKIDVVLIQPWLFDDAKVEVRFDKDEPFLIDGDTAEDRKMYFLSTPLQESASSENLIKLFSSKKRLLIRYQDLGKGTKIAEFSISGFEKEYKKAIKYCEKNKPVKEAE